MIAPDGTVYLGNEQGKLMSFKPDGARGWNRDIAPGQMIVASPVIDAQGSVYVIGVKTVRDQRVNPPVTTYESTLNKFTSGGAWVLRVPFPHRFDGAAVSAPPNIWRSGAAEAIMVPAIYRNRLTGGFLARLVAFSTSGEIMADTQVSGFVPTVTVGWDWCFGSSFWGLCGFHSNDTARPGDPADRLPNNTVVPHPGVATFTYASGGTQSSWYPTGFRTWSAIRSPAPASTRSSACTTMRAS